MAIQNFEDLIGWQKAYALCHTVYKLTQDFPKEEQYGLASHLRKTAISCPSNIAEGFERKNDKEFNTFIRFALGSLAELKTQIYLAKDLGYLCRTDHDAVVKKIDEVRKILHGLRGKLK